MKYPKNFGPVEVRLETGTVITIYVPGKYTEDNIVYAELLYNTPGIFLIPSSGDEYNLYYGTIDDNSKFLTSMLRHLLKYQPIIDNFHSFLDYIDAIYSNLHNDSDNHYLSEFYHEMHPSDIISKINSMVDMLDVFLKNHAHVIYENVYSNYLLLINAYEFPMLDENYFPRSLNSNINMNNRIEYIDEYKNTIYHLYYGIKDPGFN
jgi:hypothetical protein